MRRFNATSDFGLLVGDRAIRDLDTSERGRACVEFERCTYKSRFIVSIACSNATSVSERE